MIGELTSQLKLSRDRYYTLEGEFIQYRKHTQVWGGVYVVMLT